MTIDIISYTSEQFALLSEEQLLEVKSAQIKKNRLTAALQESLKKEKFRLIKNGTFLSTNWDAIQEQLENECKVEVESLRDGLLFYLQYCAKPENTEDAPYLVDYSLSLEERLEIVKSYYETTYSDAGTRAEVYKNDKVAAKYLGEYFSPLYEYFLSLV